MECCDGNRDGRGENVHETEHENKCLVRLVVYPNILPDDLGSRPDQPIRRQRRSHSSGPLSRKQHWSVNDEQRTGWQRTPHYIAVLMRKKYPSVNQLTLWLCYSKI